MSQGVRILPHGEIVGAWTMQQISKEQRDRERFARNFVKSSSSPFKELAGKRKDPEAASLAPLFVRYSLVKDGIDPGHNNASINIARARIGVDLLRSIPHVSYESETSRTAPEGLPRTRAYLWDEVSRGILSGRAGGKDLTTFLDALLDPVWLTKPEQASISAMFAPPGEQKHGGRWRLMDQEIAGRVFADLKRKRRQTYQTPMMCHIMRAVVSQLTQGSKLDSEIFS